MSSHRVKKIIYLANHRGTKENDLLLGSFALNQAKNFSQDELDLFESFLEERDDFIYNWIMEQESSPPIYVKLCQKIKNNAQLSPKS